MNQIGVIVPYRYEGMWVFDDPAVGLVREPFIAGIDAMIERLVASILGAAKGFRLFFSAAPCPGDAAEILAPQKAGRQLVLLPTIRNGMLALPCALPPFRPGPTEALCPRQAQKPMEFTSCRGI